MRARQIGYSPVDTVAVIDMAGVGATVRLAMHRIPAFLPLVTVDTVPSRAQLVGRIVRPDGAPVSGAAVEVVGTHDTATTDATGHFTIRAGQPGPYVVSVRRLGFEPSRFAATFTSQSERDVSVTLVRTIPVLPVVTTTAAERAAYRDVGLDQRMQAGIGQFLTDAQIEHLQATKLSELLGGMRGIAVLYAPAELRRHHRRRHARIRELRRLRHRRGPTGAAHQPDRRREAASSGRRGTTRSTRPRSVRSRSTRRASDPLSLATGLFEHPQPPRHARHSAKQSGAHVGESAVLAGGPLDPHSARPHRHPYTD